MKRIFQVSLIVASVFALVSCNKEYEDIISDTGFKGVFVRNEGGSISYYNDVESTTTVDIYQEMNGAALESKVLAFSLFGNKGYILHGEESAQKIEVVDAETFVTQGSFDKTFAHLNDFAAVSDDVLLATQGVAGEENAGSVLVLNNALEPLVDLKVGNNPTRIAYSRGKKAYVANTGGGEFPDSTLMVIDISLKEVVDTIALEQQIDEATILKLNKPVEMVIDAYQNIWVLCAGEGSQGAGLAKVSYGTHEVKVFPFVDGYEGGAYSLCTSIGGGTIYYVNDGMYALGIDDDELPTEKFLKETGFKDVVFDAIGVNPYTGKFFCAKDNGSGGIVYIFDRYGYRSGEEEIAVGEMPRQLTFVR